MTALNVFFTERAPLARAQWLQKLLEPVAAACMMNAMPPLQIQATGHWGGWCANASMAPDGRVVLSTKIVFWSAETIISVYLHEAAHRLLQGRKIESHGPEFCCVQAILLHRAQRYFEQGAWSNLKIYDIADQPAGLEDDVGWHGTVLNWLIGTAAELAESDTSAEDLASVVCSRWQAFLIERQARRVGAAKAAAGAISQRKLLIEQLASLKNSRVLWRALAGLGWLMFLVLGWFNL